MISLECFKPMKTSTPRKTISSAETLYDHPTHCMTMKHLITLFLLACGASALSGAIPQLINYQGLLLDDNGSKVTGVKAITLKVFTGATDGNGTKEIYDENVGNVAVTDGLYAFNFGGSGQSVITTTETVGLGDGATQIFNYTVEHARFVIHKDRKRVFLYIIVNYFIVQIKTLRKL